VGHPIETEVALDISHNKPIGCGAFGAYASNPNEEEEEEEEAPDSSGGISIASHIKIISSVITV
jgi:hypothetical protein